MIICPFCGHQNIEGVDVCEQCGQSLVNPPTPATAVERGLLKDTVRTLKPKAPIVVKPDTPISEVLQLLVEQKIGCVIVSDYDHHVVGIFSERDALLKLNTDVAELATRPVSQFMTTPAECLDHRAKIAFAVHKMDVGGYRHLPVVCDDEGHATGVISVRDIMRYLTEKMSSMGSS